MKQTILSFVFSLTIHFISAQTIESVQMNTESSAFAIRGVIHSTTPGGFSTGVRGVNNGTGGLGIGVYGSQNGSGWGVYGTTPSGRSVYGNSTGSGIGVYAEGFDGIGLYSKSQYNSAGFFEITNTENYNHALRVSTIGYGNGIHSRITNTSSVSAAVRAETNTRFSNFGSSAIYGIASGTGGSAGTFYVSNTIGDATGIITTVENNGNGIVTKTNGNGDALVASAEKSGTSIYGYISSTGSGRAAHFVNHSTTNANPTVTILNAGTNTALLINHVGSAGNTAVFQNAFTNVARIDRNGKGFFNGGTQASGADLAEAFDVTDSIHDYEPGDVLVIAIDKDRTVEKSATAYSALVAGVYATKPGILLTDTHIDTDIKDRIPMGVVGVIPTKVSTEGGSIKRGDLLVTSSTPGVAMKADPDKVRTGQVLGKALQEHDSDKIEKINVLVNAK